MEPRRPFAPGVPRVPPTGGVELLAISRGGGWGGVVTLALVVGGVINPH